MSTLFVFLACAAVAVVSVVGFIYWHYRNDKDSLR